MRIIYTSDLHSNKNFYNQLYELINNAQADEVILGGDLFAYSNSYKEQISFMKEFLMPFLKSVKVPVSLIAGNTDLGLVFEKLKENLSVKQYNFLSYKPHYIGSKIPVYGFPFVTPSPFKLKNFERRDLSNDNILIAAGYVLDGNGNQVSVLGNYLNTLPSIEEEINSMTITDSILVTHVPPSGGVLDLLSNNETAGSKAVRQKIIREKPILSLHGHIHESPRMSGKWYEEIGETLSINPGQSNEFHAVIIDIDPVRVNVKHTVYGEISKSFS
nr:metallophosphoesterase [Paenibacillus bovis]